MSGLFQAIVGVEGVVVGWGAGVQRRLKKEKERKREKKREKKRERERERERERNMHAHTDTQVQVHGLASQRKTYFYGSTKRGEN